METQAISKKPRKQYTSYYIRSTNRQKALAKAIAANNKQKKPHNKKELLESVGYSKNTAEANAEGIITSKGVQKELNNLGFNPDNAKRVVAEILEDTSQEAADRLRATDQVFKVHGLYKEDKGQHNTLNIALFSTEQQERIALRIMQQLSKDIDNKPSISE